MRCYVNGQGGMQCVMDRFLFLCVMGIVLCLCTSVLM